MDLERARDFMRAHHRAVLATTRSDGRPQLSPVTVGVDEVGRILISTRETAVKTKNLARDPRASLCVMNDRFFGEWVQAEGAVEIMHLPEAMDLLVDYYRRVSGEHPDWDDYRNAMVRDQRVIVAITLTRAGPDHSG
ncbi:MAG TPA: PPOX class F420-dependent oxidoreductase [Streptosporangiaceae bacterium]|jgi:PPOX class probable F420-dependent enzyme|nr:PPOX class F420-dependent oxidoreductase [Streptosporangiaceae bacterium]